MSGLDSSRIVCTDDYNEIQSAAGSGNTPLQSQLLGRLRQENPKFEVSLINLERHNLKIKRVGAGMGNMA